MELHLRTSLAVQWLGLHISTIGGLGSIPVWGTKILPATWHSLKKKKGRNKESMNYIFPILPAPSPWQKPFYSPPPHHSIIYNRQYGKRLTH